MFRTALALAAVLALARADNAAARTHYRYSHRYGAPYGSYAQNYSDYHSSLPTRPRYWYRGNFRSNTYPTYAPGVGGCVDDLGYGRVGGGVCN